MWMRQGGGLGGGVSPSLDHGRRVTASLKKQPEKKPRLRSTEYPHFEFGKGTGTASTWGRSIPRVTGFGSPSLKVMPKRRTGGA